MLVDNLIAIDAGLGLKAALECEGAPRGGGGGGHCYGDTGCSKKLHAGGKLI